MISVIVRVLGIGCNYENFSHVSTDIVTTDLRFLVASSDKDQAIVNRT
jgi:hypothetical protein